jgi:glycosyltransferase involved in cell wall biosynthesis
VILPDTLGVAVVVPSFGRPETLGACLESLRRQTPAPAETVVVGRGGDDETRTVADEAGVRHVSVAAAGHLPPLAAGVAATTAGIVCFLDDDAEAWPGWTAALARHFADPSVGGAGGLVSQPGAGERRVAGSVCRLPASGRFDSLRADWIPAAWGPRDADALRGTNMAFRRSLIERYPWDARLNRGAATDYEIDLSAWVRRNGFRLVYDPDAIVTHRPAPRPEIGRDRTPAAIEDYSHNLVYVAGKALPPARAAVALAHAFLVGNRHSYGLAAAAGDTLLGRPPGLREEVWPALAGKLAGLRSLREYRRSGPEALV